jgi:hypothetical protein
VNSFFTQQNLLLFIGVLLLASPAIMGSVVLWVKQLLYKNTIQEDGKIRTVVQLLQLKSRLEKEGCTVAADTCKDLTFAVIYDEKPKKDA